RGDDYDVRAARGIQLVRERDGYLSIARLAALLQVLDDAEQWLRGHEIARAQVRHRGDGDADEPAARVEDGGSAFAGADRHADSDVGERKDLSRELALESGHEPHLRRGRQIERMGDGEGQGADAGRGRVLQRDVSERWR